MLHRFGDGKRDVEIQPRHEDYKVELTASKEIERSLLSIGADNSRYGVEVQLEIFSVNLLGQDTVGFDNE